VQVHDLPLLCMNKGVGLKIGASLGEVVDIDVAGDGAGWGRCLRLRIVIDLGVPLERGRALELGGHSHWVSFKYEKLPRCCFHCGRVVHDGQGCPLRKAHRVHGEEEVKQWGTWIRAETMSGVRPGRSDAGGWFNGSAASYVSPGGSHDKRPAKLDGAGGGEPEIHGPRRGSDAPGMAADEMGVGDQLHDHVPEKQGTTWSGGGETVGPLSNTDGLSTQAVTGMMGRLFTIQDGPSLTNEVNHEGASHEVIKGRSSGELSNPGSIEGPLIGPLLN
jgi:hypothetical protein